MSLADKVGKLERVTLAEQVYADLRELILAGQMSPGEKITLRGLAEAMGTSPMPVRAAMTRLAAEEALEVLPNRTLRIPVVTRDRFIELKTIRMEIEGFAAQQAALNATSREIEEAIEHQNVFEKESSKAKPDGARAMRANKDLHFTVYRASRLPQLVAIIEGLWLKVGPIINLDLRADGRRLQEVEAHKQHAKLIAALEARDGQAARQAVADDIRTAAEFILASNRLPTN